MKLTNLGGATAIIEHKGKRILTDPWLDDGIFHGAWYHYPPLKVGISDIGHIDYIYISHIHEDHCSVGTLSQLNRDAEVIIADKNPNFVDKLLKSNGLIFKKVYKVPPRSPIEIIPGMVVDVIEADPANEMAFAVDSALVLQWDGFTIYNANDCQPYPDAVEYIKANYQVDLALLPYSGGSGYPACYLNLTNAEKATQAQKILDKRLDHFKQVAAEIAPRWVMPFADQYVIAGSRSHLNQYISHPPSPEIVSERFGSHIGNAQILLMNSGQSFDFDIERFDPDTPYESHSREDREKYILETLQDKKYEHELFKLSPAVSLSRLVQIARRRLWEEQKRRDSFPKWTVYIEVQQRNELFEINLTNENVEIHDLNKQLIEPYLRIVLSPTLAAMILIGHMSINIADAALFLDYERKPDIYEPELYFLLNLLRC
jgi:UDP-MurNAc hydroxylase